MAATDITAKATLVKGVNSLNNFTRSEAHLIDGSEHAGILTVATHNLFVIPKGNMLTGLKVVALSAVTSDGSATVQFKANINSTAEAIHTAIAVANLAAGDVHVLPVAAIKGYDADHDTTIQLTVAVAALTALKVLVVAEYIPVVEFMTAG